VTALSQKATEAGLEFPILVDNERKNWRAWGNRVWPSVYVIDKHGYLRYWWFGELNFRQAGGQTILREKILELIDE
jgi:peroxiredoxin